MCEMINCVYAQYTQVYSSCLEIQFKTLVAASLCSVAFQVNRNDNVYSDCRRLFNHAVNRFFSFEPFLCST